MKKNKTKHNTTCVGHHYMQSNTNNINKTTGGKNEPNIVILRRCISTGEICLPSDGFVERLLHVNRYEFFYEYVTYVYSLNIIYPNDYCEINSRYIWLTAIFENKR
jgi:hypothetical protein